MDERDTYSVADQEEKDKTVSDVIDQLREAEAFLVIAIIPIDGDKGRVHVSSVCPGDDHRREMFRGIVADGAASVIGSMMEAPIGGDER